MNEASKVSPDMPTREARWLIALAVVLVAIIGWFLWTAVAGWDRRSADERLAEIEAGCAIPDAENAAMIYNQLLQDPNATSLSDRLPESLVQTYGRSFHEPWLGKTHPDLAGWIREHQYIIDRLFEASRLEKCRFPINTDITDPSEMNRTAPMCQWAFLLTSAANKDIAEGQVDAALAKWECLIQMRNHLRQNPLLTVHLLADHVEELALEPMARFIVTGDPTEKHLQKIEAMPLPTKDCWVEYDRETRLTDELRLRRLREQFGPLERLKFDFALSRMKRILRSTTGDESPFDRAGYVYRRNVAAARGIRILVALRRYQDANGHWPESLDTVRSSLSEEILTDPFNKGPFVYRLAAGAFKLYSKGVNNIDENSEWPSKTGDDWPIWPPRGRSPQPEPRDANGV
jgi:hypothetical protein